MARPSRGVTAGLLIVVLALCAAYATPQVRLRLRLFQYGIAQGTSDGRRGWKVADGAVFWMMVPPRNETMVPADAMPPPRMPSTPEWRLITAVINAPPALQPAYEDAFLRGYHLGLDGSLWRTVIAATLTAAFVAFVSISAIRRRRRG